MTIFFQRSDLWVAKFATEVRSSEDSRSRPTCVLCILNCHYFLVYDRVSHHSYSLCLLAQEREWWPLSVWWPWLQTAQRTSVSYGKRRVCQGQDQLTVRQCYSILSDTISLCCVGKFIFWISDSTNLPWAWVTDNSGFLVARPGEDCELFGSFVNYLVLFTGGTG